MLNYTTEELLQYLYNETTNEQSFAIKKALQTNWDLQEKFNSLKASRNHLDTVTVSPRPQSVMAILNYARSTAVLEQQ